MEDFSGLRMSVDVIGEYGYQQALYGLSLSYNLSDSWVDFTKRHEEGLFDRIRRVTLKLFGRDNGENKFLESICVWLDINAPRYWWQEMDTYRAGMTKQSASTMHTMLKRPLTQADFVEDIDPWFLMKINIEISRKNFRWVKRHLPESFLQRREVCTNYKTLRHIFYQRKNHRLPEWHLFMNSVSSYIEHPEFLDSNLPIASTIGTTRVVESSDGVQILVNG